MIPAHRHLCLRCRPSLVLARLASSAPAQQTPPPHEESQKGSNEQSPNTHFKITLRRSAISLPENIKATLVSLGIHRRMQTVYHPHSPEVAGKILTVKELVEVENVPREAVRTKLEQRLERKPARGYQVVGSKLDGSPLR